MPYHEVNYRHVKVSVAPIMSDSVLPIILSNSLSNFVLVLDKIGKGVMRYCDSKC